MIDRVGSWNDRLRFFWQSWCSCSRGALPVETPLPEYVECASAAPVFTGNTSAPVITLNGPRVFSQPLGTAYADQGATASDPRAIA